jgi:hypothetical protein
MPFSVACTQQTTQSSMIGCPTIASTRSRNCLPGLKCGTRFSGTITLSPDFGLRPMRGGTAVQRKAAETTDLDALPGRQRVGHRIEDGLDHVIRILCDQLRITLGQTCNQFRLGH